MTYLNTLINNKINKYFSTCLAILSMFLLSSCGSSSNDDSSTSGYRLKSVTSTNGDLTYYKYNNLGQLSESTLEEIDPDNGETLLFTGRYKYNDSSQLIEKKIIIVIHSSQNILVETSTDIYSYEYKTLDSNILSQEVVFNEWNNSTGILNKRTTTTSTYKHDSSGKVISKNTSDTNNSTSTTIFQYDGNNQLISAKDKYENYSYSYNDLGKLIEQVVGQESTATYSYNDKQQLVSIAISNAYSNDSTTTYEYKEDGRLLSSKNETDTWTYVYEELPCTIYSYPSSVEVSPFNFNVVCNDGN